MLFNKFSITLLLIILIPPLAAAPITLYSEEFPPFNYTDNGKFIGASTEVVEAIMKISEQEYEIKSFPWARSMHISQSKENAFIFSISRRQSRENLFKWVGILVPANQSVFALKSRKDIKINQLEDMKNFTIGTTFKDAREAYLLTRGFDFVNLKRLSGENTYQQHYKQLKQGRIDLWPMPNAVMNHVVTSFGDKPDNWIQNVFKLDEISQEGYYLAASLTTSDALVNKLRQALIEFKQSEAYSKIIVKWGL
ncbi:MAG: substrate-binding periplasmic protein [Marinomonas sp.]